MDKLAITLAGALLVSVAACSQKTEPQQAAQPAAPAPAAQQTMQQPAAAPVAQAPAAMPQTAMPAGHPAGVATQMNSAPQAGANAGQGKIVQSMHASSYTYMEVDMSGKKVWIATNAMAVNNGDTVRWRDAAVMKNFTSNALHRTFDEILFVSYAEIAK
ncbi:MAG: hypothetical protein HY273_06210 [Gammaproteobacteria bacterium]|nr:hypothetical protein [Gammaproteobacteria bacterium]